MRPPRPTATGPAAEALAEAERLGATAEQLDALWENLSDADFVAELVEPEILPAPGEATPEEFPLAAAFANVRARRAGELGRARAGRRAGGSTQAERNRDAARERLRRLGLWAALSPHLTAGQLHARLAVMTAVERESRTGSPELPSLRTVQRARRNRVK